MTTQADTRTVPALVVRDLSVSFPTPRGQIRPVADVNLTIDQGEIVGVVGESGSGKTMLAMAISQLVPYPGRVTAASIDLHGVNVLGDPPKVRSFLGRHLANVFQNPMSTLNPALRVGIQVAEPALVHQTISRRAAFDLAAQRMQEVSLPAPRRLMSRYPHQLSGGMLQRASIAMALMNDPALIIADEPTTALDVTTQAQILSLLRDINADTNSAIMLISHDIGVIAQICLRVLVMYAGRIVEDLPISQLATGAKHPYTRALMDATVDLGTNRSAPLRSIIGETPDLAQLPLGCPYAPRCPLRESQCDTARPSLAEVTGDHRVACWVATRSVAGE